LRVEGCFGLLGLFVFFCGIALLFAFPENIEIVAFAVFLVGN
jgi:hypothetical protein